MQPPTLELPPFQGLADGTPRPSGRSALAEGPATRAGAMARTPGGETAVEAPTRRNHDFRHFVLMHPW